ncbi:MAG TPA: ABC transporter ATP-binding protein [Gemmatimonadaceae bacterium]|nr:ABC transporter ATP-binding protein [Gemmatimonadaceae bacterium]
MLAASRAPLLQLRSVTKYYRCGLPGPDAGVRVSVLALAGVQLSVCAGEVVAVLGPAASGKTTLLLCAAGLIPPDSGEVRWAKHHPRAAMQAPAGVCFVSSGAYRDRERLARCMRNIERSWLVLIDEPPFQGEHVRGWLTAVLAARAGVALAVRRPAVMVACREPLHVCADRVVRLSQGRVVDRIEGVKYSMPSSAARVGEL